MIGCGTTNGVMFLRPDVCQSWETPYVVTPQSIDLADVSILVWSIVGVWAVAWAIRMTIQTIWTSRNLGGKNDNGD